MTYCDVSLPVPLDQAFTYRLPETMQHRVRPGCRLLVPFGPQEAHRHGTRAAAGCAGGPGAVKEALRLVDEEPVLDAELLSLGRWIAQYYCAPLGEVLRSMTPLERRGSQDQALFAHRRRARYGAATAAGRRRGRSDAPDSETARSPAAVGVLSAKETAECPERDSVAGEEGLRRDGGSGSAARSAAGIGHPAARVVGWRAAPEGLKLTKRERELHAFLELHPGTHNLEQLETSVKGASQAARSLARRNLITLEPEAPTGVFTTDVPPRTLNPHQLEAYQQIEARAARRQVSYLSAGRRHRLGENRGVSEVDRRHHCAGPQRVAAGAGDRADARRGRTVLPSLWRSRGDSAFGLSRCRARRAMAADSRAGSRPWWWARARACSRRCRTWGWW